VDGTISVEKKREGESCPFCREALREAEELCRCEKCGTALHASCASEYGGKCTVLGCGGRLLAKEGTPIVVKVPSAERAAPPEPRYGVRPARTPSSVPAWVTGPLGLIAIFLVPPLGIAFGASLDSKVGVAIAILSGLVSVATMIAVAFSARD
jgi:hypothetical protein